MFSWNFENVYNDVYGFSSGVFFFSHGDPCVIARAKLRLFAFTHLPLLELSCGFVKSIEEPGDCQSKSERHSGASSF